MATLTGEPSAIERLKAALNDSPEFARATSEAVDNLMAAYAESDKTIKRALAEVAPKEWSDKLADFAVGLLTHDLLKAAISSASLDASSK